MGSCALGVSCVCPKLNLGVLEFADVRLAKGLLAGAGVLAPPNVLVAGAGVAASAGLGVAAPPKLKMPVDDVAGAAAGVLSVPDVLVAPNPPNMLFCGVAAAGVPSLFCASLPAPKPPKAGAAAGAAPFCVDPPKLKMLDEAGAGVLVLAGAAELVAPNEKAGVLELAGAAELVAPPNWKDEVLDAAGALFPPKLKVGCEAGAGVLGAAAADELAPPNVKEGVDAPFVVPNMLVDPDELLVLV